MKRQLSAEQKAKSIERKSRFRALVKQVADMTDVERATLTSRVGAVLTCEGRELSLTNTILCIIQCPVVSMVGGYRQWLKVSRCVRKGEHGMSIWVPIGHKKDSESVPDTNSESTERPGFIMGTVFDISQTDTLEVENPIASVSPDVADAFGMRQLPNVRVPEVASVA